MSFVGPKTRITSITETFQKVTALERGHVVISKWAL